MSLTTLGRNIHARAFECRSQWSHQTTQAGTIVCSIDVDLPFDFIAHGSFTGHGLCNSGWMYGTVGMPGDVALPGDDAQAAPAHTYSTHWETFRSSRVKRFAKGKHTFSLRLRSSNANSCFLNGGGLKLVTIAADDADFKTFACTPQNWQNQIQPNVNGQFPCTTQLSTSVESVVYGTFTGHARVNGDWLYSAVSLNDVTGSDAESGARQYSSAHTYS
jgi:hypothetical protein